MNNQVYLITNLVNNKKYIGITNQGFKVRWKHHCYEAKSGSTFHLHRAMIKYGFDQFYIEVMCECETYERLKELEKIYIEKYNSYNRDFGYNLTKGGDGTFGRFHSEGTKEKIRQKAIGRKKGVRSKKIQKIKSNKGILTMIERSKKPIAQYDLNGKLIATFPSVKEAARLNDINKCTIYSQMKQEFKPKYI
jgi:group I intron endonuclease